MFKKWSLVFISLMIITSLFVGCGTKSGRDEAKSQLNVQETKENTSEWDTIISKAKTQKKILVFTFKYDNYFVEAAKSFKEKYGIQVDVEMGKNEAALQKVMAEKGGKCSYDAWVLSGPTVKAAMDQGLIVDALQSKLSNAKNIYPPIAKYAEGYDYKGAAIPVWKNQSVFVYNSKYVKEPPKNFDELEKWITANPKKFCYSDPASGGAGQAFVNSIIYWKTGGADQYTGDFKKDLIDKKWPSAWDWLRKIGPNVLYASNNNDILDKINRGEAMLGVTWEEMVVGWKNQGQLTKDAVMYIPENGLPGGADYVTIPKNAQNKEAAMLFLNYLLETDTQKLLSSLIYMHPVVTNAKVSQELIDKMLSDDYIAKYTQIWPYVDYKNYYKENWKKEINIK